jgi:hypothetical protein
MPSKFKSREEYEEWKASQLEQNPEQPAELQKDNAMLRRLLRRLPFHSWKRCLRI